MKRVFKFKKDSSWDEEDTLDAEIFNFLKNTMLDYKVRLSGTRPVFKNNFKVTVIIEKVK